MPFIQKEEIKKKNERGMFLLKWFLLQVIFSGGLICY